MICAPRTLYVSEFTDKLLEKQRTSIVQRPQILTKVSLSRTAQISLMMKVEFDWISNISVCFHTNLSGHIENYEEIECVLFIKAEQGLFSYRM